MIVYVGAGSGPFRDMVIASGHGQMVSRQSDAFRIPKAGRWAFDNGAFTDWKNAVPFDNEEFLRRIRKISELPDERLPDWCVCPDMVASNTSLEHSLEWKSMLKDYAPRLKWFLALQDYVHPDDVDHALCLEKFHGIFIGGTDHWKFDTSPAWVEWGHRRGLPVHVARINGPSRLSWAQEIGADSVDGTGWVHAGERWARFLREIPEPIGLLPPPSKDFPKEWVRFGAWLQEIYSEKDWKARLQEEDAQWEWTQSFWAMSPEEFVQWYNRSYPASITLPQGGFRDKDEYHEWVMDNLAQAERFFGTKPVPPQVELPMFAIDECGDVLPPKEIPPGRVRWCDNIRNWTHEVLGPMGDVIRVFILIPAASLSEAKKRAAEAFQPKLLKKICRPRRK